MKERILGIFWGIVLILAGGWFLLSGRGFIIEDPYLGIAFLAVLSALFFTSYFVSGPNRWGWLFPACILAGATVTAALSLIPGNHGGWIGSPVLLGVAAPFVVSYFIRPETRSWAWIPAYILVVLALIAALADLIPGEFIGTLVLLAVALPFLLSYLRNRARTGALITAIILAVVSIIPPMAGKPGIDSVWPLIIIAGGAWLIYRSYRRKPA